MSVSQFPDEPGSDLLEDDDDPLFPFGPMPTEPLIAHDRSQAFRFLSYGKGTRCVVTNDYEMMVAVGSTRDLKGYVNGWFRAHGSMCRVGITQAPTPGWSQMILALDDDFHDDRDEGHDVDVELDMGFLDAVDYLVDDDGDGDDDEDMLEALDLDPDYLPGFEPPMSESDIELDDMSSDEDTKEHCENCGSDSHNLGGCHGPTDAGGYLPGCPLCNTIAHDLDACAELDGPRDRLSVHRLHTRLVVRRRGRAPFRSERMPWTKALLVGRAWGLECAGPFPWSDEMAERLKGEVEADLEGHEGYEEEDPVTGSLEAVREAVGAGMVPDPGDFRDWMPSGRISSPAL